MKLLDNPKVRIGLLTALVGAGLAAALLLTSSPTPVAAQNTPKTQETKTPEDVPKPASGSPSTNAPSPAVTNRAALTRLAASPAPTAVGTNPASAMLERTGPTAPPPKTDADPGPPSDEISLSFQNAQIDMVTQWLAKTTGKSVVKHKMVQCQLTIVSSKKLTQREAVNLVYRALALEGFSTVETSKSIIIFPEGQDPKLTPEILQPSRTEIPAGRERLLKIFQLQNSPPGELRDKVRAVLSDKATVEVNERNNQLMVTDYGDNLRLLAELIKELDVAPMSDAVIEIYMIKHLDVDEMSNLLNLILNAQAPGPAAPRPSPPPPSADLSMPSPGGPSMMMGGRSMPPGMSISRPSSPPPSSGSSASGSSSGGQAAGGLVRFWPDHSANRLIVAAPKAKQAEVKRLIDLLDTEKAEDMGVRVIALKNVNATDLVKEIGPLYERIRAKSPKDEVQVSANERSNSLIVLSSEANFKAVEKLVSRLDTEEAQEKVMQAFSLKNADAEDVAKQLQDLNQDSSSRYPYYYYYGFGGNQKSGGKLSVVADRRRNVVIVQAPPNAMEGIAKMIKSLDEPVSDNSLAPKIIHLKFVGATDIEDVLNELFLKKTQNRSYFYFFDDYPQETADRNVGRLYGKVRITSEPYSNNLIITANSAENLAAVEEVVRKLDVPSEEGETTLRVSLNFAKAITVANNLNILFAKAASPPLRQQPGQPGQPQNPGNPQQNQQNYQNQDRFQLEQKSEEDTYYPWLGGQQENIRGADGRNVVRPVSDLVGRIRVVPDKRSNAILVTCNVHFFPQVKKMIEELDAPTAQVLIDAKILEVSSESLDKLGVRWAPNGAQSWTGDDLENSIMSGTKSIPGATATVPGVPAAPGAAAGPGTVVSYSKTFTGSVLANALHYGTLNTSVNVDVLIQALRRDTDATVLASPQLNISDNEMGNLFVGSRVPLLNNSVVNGFGGGGVTQSYQYQDVGVILDVTPHVNSSEDVALRIHAESSSLQNQVLLGGPVINSRNFKTDLMVKNGQTVVLGGIIQREEQRIVRKVPLLGDIPLLGFAFKKKDTVKRDTELMVFLTPKISRTVEEARRLLDDLERKAPNVKTWMEQNSTEPAKAPRKKR